MAEVVLAAEVGRPTGSRSVRRLRRDGKVPGVIYGHGTDPLPIAVGARELRAALTGEAGLNQLLSLDTGSGTYLTIAREMQRHPVAQTLTHVDFVIVRRDEVISADVPITLVGEAVAVQHGDGLVEQQLFTLAINALPAAIPSVIEADVSELTIGGQVRVSDLALPADVTTDVDPDSAVVVGQPPRVVVEEEVEEGVEGEEAAEGEAARAAAAGEAAPEATSEEG
jgi:large subunit ribosomal protein L25